MAKAVIMMDFDTDGFSQLEDEERFEIIEDMINIGADSTNSSVNIHCIEIKNG